MKKLYHIFSIQIEYIVKFVCEFIYKSVDFLQHFTSYRKELGTIMVYF